MKRYWLMKTEPGTFSFQDLLTAPQRTTCWEGVRNYQARNFMRDEFRKNDGVLFYHSRVDEPGVVGLAKVVKEAYPDRFSLDPSSRYFDSKAAKKGETPWVMVDIAATHRLGVPVDRKKMQSNTILKKMQVLKKGMRLSIIPVTEAEYKEVVKIGKAVRV